MKLTFFGVTQTVTGSWLSGFKRGPRQTFLVHGEPRAIEAMKDHIVATYKGWGVEMPKYLQNFEI